MKKGSFYKLGMICTFALSLVVSSVAVAATDTPGNGQKVNMARGSWAGSNYVQSFVVMKALEKLGYKPDIDTLGSTIIFQSVAQGDIDFSLDANIPQASSLYLPVKNRVDLIGKGTIIGGGLNGYMIDKKTSEKYNITGLEQLKDPEIAKLFDADGNGKANLYQCDFGWGCASVVTHQLKAFELEGTVQSMQGNYDLLMGEVLARYKRGQPVLYYTWSPYWTMTELRPGEEVVWLQIPFKSLPDGVEDDQSPEVEGVVGCAGATETCRMAQGSWNYHAVINKSFQEKNPVVVALLEQVGWERSQWDQWEKVLAEGKTDDRTMQRLADEWIASNGDVFNEWITNAADAAED